MDDRIRTDVEAAAFRGLVKHLRRRTDVQNIDLMNLAGFCRNCLAKWVMAAAAERGAAMTYDEARAYQAVERIDWPEGFCRRDIAWRAIGSQP